MAAQFDRPTPQDTAVVERGGLLPFGTYANGMTGPAIPGFITQPFESATTGDLLFANGGRPGAAVGQLIQQYGYGAPFGALPDYRDVI